MGIIYDKGPGAAPEVPAYHPDNRSGCTFYWVAWSRAKPPEPDAIRSVDELPARIHATVASDHIRNDRRGPISIVSCERKYVEREHLVLPEEDKDLAGMWQYKIMTTAAWR